VFRTISSVAGPALILALALAACADSEPAVRNTGDPIGDLGPGGAGGDIGPGEPAEIGPIPTPGPIPDDWATYEDPTKSFSLRFPAGWRNEQGTLYSFEQPTGEPIFPVDGIKMWAVYRRDVERPDGAQNISVGPFKGWGYLERYHPAKAANIESVYTIALDDEEGTILIVGILADEADEDTFWKVVGSIQIPES
jgi:hypothetical protein